MISLLRSIFGVRQAPQIRLSAADGPRGLSVILSTGEMVGCEGRNVFTLNSPRQLQALIDAGIPYEVVRGQKLINQTIGKN